MARREVSPWLADAATGATGATYEIRTLDDFLKVPESRRFICLREFHAWLSMREGMVDLLKAVAQSQGAEIEVGVPNTFSWRDDGLATATINITEATTTLPADRTEK